MIKSIGSAYQRDDLTPEATAGRYLPFSDGWEAQTCL